MTAPYFQTDPLLEAQFIERPSRFIVRYCMGDEEGRAYMANPGKLQEILVPGTTLLLARRPHTKVGLYLAILTLPERIAVEVGRRGLHTFESRHSIYIGPAKRNLTRRVERHKRKRKGMHYHIDYLRQVASQVQTVPIRGAATECELATAIANLGERVPDFRSSGCRCPGHLVHCSADPVRTGAFQELLTTWRHR